MQKMAILVATLVAVGLSSCASAKFGIESSAYSGAAEKGFDSGTLSDGRADPAFNGDVSLPFTWKNLPQGTKAIALVYDDPDARLIMKEFGVPGDTWIHWAVTDLDPSLGGLKADAAKLMDLVTGKNSWGNNTYGGPAPPPDVPKSAQKPIIHVYQLTVYALSEKTGLADGFTVTELQKSIEGKVLAQAQLKLSWNN